MNSGCKEVYNNTPNNSNNVVEVHNYNYVITSITPSDMKRSLRANLTLRIDVLKN